MMLINAFTACVSSIVAILMFFVGVDIWPPAAKYLGLQNIGPVAARYRYIADDDLVFTYRNPKKRVSVPDYPGDQYLPEYGPAPLIRGGVYEYDINGFRNEDPSGKFPIVAIGDSFLEVGRTNDYTLAGYLRRFTGKRVLDLGRGWYGPEQYLVLFRQLALKSAAQHVVFYFFEGNDLSDTAEYAAWKSQRTYYHFPSTNLFRRYYGDLAWVASKFYFYGTRLLNLGRSFATSDGSSNIHPNLALIRLPSLPPMTMLFGYGQTDRSAKEIERSLEGKRLAEIFSEIKSLSDKAGLKSSIVFIPTKGHVYAKYASNGGFNWLESRNAASLDSPKIEEVVAALAGSAGLGFASLTPLFDVAAQQGELLYYRFDSHWNEAGRRLAAQFLTQYLDLLSTP